jgi:hypothetical protein
VNASYDILSYASMETEYDECELLVEAMWYKVPAIDIIEVNISVTDPCKLVLYPAFFLRFPDEDETDVANIPLEGEDCLGELETVSAKFYIWCHDFGGWSVFMLEEGQFQLIGRTKLDSPIGEWVVIVVDRETGEAVAELPLYVEITKPTKMRELLSKKYG